MLADRVVGPISRHQLADGPSKFRRRMVPSLIGTDVGVDAIGARPFQGLDQ